MGARMHTIIAENVRDALPKAVKYLLHFGAEEKTRLGDAWVSPMPVTIKYYQPKQHVLINQYRDANPFFHLMEAIWMLDGRDDGKFLDNYIKNFSKQFGINGKILDAYGYRWRKGLSFDQIQEVIIQLSTNETTRQAVVQMWGAGREDLLMETAKPCNLAAAFRINKKKLDMTVFNRSNDLLWGCCGANAVHFAILQEYVAGMIGIPMGIYYQVSNNLHLYKDQYDIMLKKIGKHNVKASYAFLADTHNYGATDPLIEFPSVFDVELQETLMIIDMIHKDQDYYKGNISNSFLLRTVIPMAQAHRYYKKGMLIEALSEVSMVHAPDWRRAGQEWIQRRIK